MQKYDFHFISQVAKWIFRGFSFASPTKELTIEQAINMNPAKAFFAYVKETTGEYREAVGTAFTKSKRGNILYYDLEANALRSFKPENLKTKIKVA